MHNTVDPNFDAAMWARKLIAKAENGERPSMKISDGFDAVSWSISMFSKANLAK